MFTILDWLLFVAILIVRRFYLFFFETHTWIDFHFAWMLIIIACEFAACSSQFAVFNVHLVVGFRSMLTLFYFTHIFNPKLNALILSKLFLRFSLFPIWFLGSMRKLLKLFNMKKATNGSTQIKFLCWYFNSDPGSLIQGKKKIESTEPWLPKKDEKVHWK